MTGDPSDPQREITLRQLYPDLSEEDLKEAERRLHDYLAAALRIWTRIHSDPEALANFEALTARESHPTIDCDRSNPQPSKPT